MRGQGLIQVAAPGASEGEGEGLKVFAEQRKEEGGSGEDSRKGSRVFSGLIPGKSLLLSLDSRRRSSGFKNQGKPQRRFNASVDIGSRTSAGIRSVGLRKVLGTDHH